MSNETGRDSRAAGVTPLPLAFLLLGTLAVHVAMFLNRPAASYRVLALDGDAQAVGLVAASSAVLPVVLAIPMGRWSDRGKAPALLLGGGAVMVLGSLLLAHAGSLPSMAASNAILGIGQLALMVAAQSVVADLSGPGQQDRNFGLFTAAASLGQLLGPLLGGWVISGRDSAELLQATTRAFWVGAGASVLILLFYGLMVFVLRGSTFGTTAPAGEAHQPGRGSALAMLRNRQLSVAVFVSFSVMATVDLLVAYMPVLGEHHGLSPTVVGLLLAVRAGFSFLSRLLIPLLLRHVERLLLLAINATLAAGIVLGVVIIGDPITLAVLMMVLGMSLGLGQPLTMTWVVREAPTQLRSTALALRITANRVAQAAGPAVAGGLSTLVGVAGPFWLMAVLLTASTGAILPLRRGPRA
ncbi:MFS transporter [Haloechinothrix sp. YIM 98757]|uniref:MFS transporter n=1 Tax=Haloechinothrix aidingensis TaxID=2752311 RepID=A0A838A3B6_9PSEU|nr:MFS transporter [Haloechinothrix aidingensis]MBA0125763.1 MFS transporter [Haloechinothrix aidingensis]